MEKRMIRFIFLCMAVVALSILTVAAQFMVNSIRGSQESVVARNAVETPAQDTAGADSLSFEQIYALSPKPAEMGEGEIDPSVLNAIETAAGEDDFSTGFRNVAPSALSDDVPVALENNAFDSSN
jgi:hypothetical protein